MRTILEKRHTESAGSAPVYFTERITPEGLIAVYRALGRKAEGKVAVKVSTGEPGGHNFLSGALIKPFVDEVRGTIVECNTAYEGRRMRTADHKRVFVEHGWTAVAPVDLMDEDGAQMALPVRGGRHLKENLVGAHLADYDFLVNLAHFKGHQMGGFGGVLKNQSIGVASSEGKSLIHSAGTAHTGFGPDTPQDDFLESMAEAAASVADYMGERILYINVMNNLSVDCDCNDHPAPPEMDDVGILASLDPVALDQACVDLVYASKKGNNRPLIERMESRHGIHTVEHAGQLGLGVRNYTLIAVD